MGVAILRTLKMQPLRLKKIAPWCLGLLLVSGFSLWAVKDLPRWALAASLSKRLTARVHVDRIEMLAEDRFLVSGLSITNLRDYPFIESLSFAEVVIDGSLSGMLSNRIDQLRLRGAEARLTPAPPTKVPDRPLPTIETLILEPATIRIATGPGTADLELCLEAVARDVGARVHGEAWLSAAELAQRPIHALASANEPPIEIQATGLVAHLVFGPDNDRLSARVESVSLAAKGGQLVLEQARFIADRFGPVTMMRVDGTAATAELGSQFATAAQPSAEAIVTATSDGTLRVEVVPQLAWLANARLQAEWDPALERARSLEASLRGLDVKGLLASLGKTPEQSVSARGQLLADAELRTVGDRLDYRLEIAPANLTVGSAAELGKIEASLTGNLPFAPLAKLQTPVWAGPLQATVRIAEGRGRWGTLALPAAIFPLKMGFTGRWLAGPTLDFAGKSEFESFGAGRLTADGKIAIQSSGKPGVDLAWTWDDIDLEQVVRWLRDSNSAVPAFELQGQAKARGSIHHAIGGGRPRVTGELRLDELTAAVETETGAFQLSGGQSIADWHWSGGQAPVELKRMTAFGTLTALGLEPLLLELQASGRIDRLLAHGQLETTLREAPMAAAGGPGLGSVDMTGGWRQGSSSATEISGTASLEGFNLARWQRIARPPERSQRAGRL